MKRFPKADNGGKLTVGLLESQIRQSLDNKVRNILSALKAVAVHVPIGVHLGKISTKECRSIRVGLECFGAS
jgi:hypothetical protein